MGRMVAALSLIRLMMYLDKVENLNDVQNVPGKCQKLFVCLEN